MCVRKSTQSTLFLVTALNYECVCPKSLCVCVCVRVTYHWRFVFSPLSLGVYPQILSDAATQGVKATQRSEKEFVQSSRRTNRRSPRDSDGAGEREFVKRVTIKCADMAGAGPILSDHSGKRLLVCQLVVLTDEFHPSMSCLYGFFPLPTGARQWNCH